MTKAQSLTSDNFLTEALASDLPVMVDFFASWCGPCRQIAPEVDAVAQQLEGKARIFKLDVDAEPGIEAEYGVKTIPTLIFFRNGELVDRIVGPVTRQAMISKLQSLMETSVA